MTDDTHSAPPSGSAIPEEMLKEMKIMREALTRPTQMQEQNPLLTFLLVKNDGTYETVMYRAMMISKVLEVRKTRNSPAYCLLSVSPEISGVQGLQYTHPRKVKIYLTLDEYKKKTTTGKVDIDMREYCVRPGHKFDKNFDDPDIGVVTAPDDGAIYAGTSPTTGKPFYAAPADEPFRVKFGKAKKRAKKKSNATGYQYRVPTLAEVKALSLNAGMIGSFNRSAYDRQAYYWTSDSYSLTQAVCVRFSTGVRKGDPMRRWKAAKLKVRLVRDGEAPSAEETPPPASPPDSTLPPSTGPTSSPPSTDASGLPPLDMAYVKKLAGGP